ncbi:glycosyltransferase [Natribacillus halophilus]|uniref:Glycosyltransferase involved in cell wall bisynthesis n=1 Tax=Natribacillus halophilus TaxID=549003 RepID=A0A1G8KFD0_9BACI|nr:glycosyltransferase [Natribacillus halophilus]SDI42131.1 Glycosyltransferase involved in cell wall bisynthesis [Natribacillus halophilus]
MRKKILFFLFSLSGGGAERTVINIINNLDKEKFEVLLILGTDQNNDYIDLLDKDIKIKFLNCSKLRFCATKLSKYIRVEKPDLLFSTINGNNIVLLIAKILSFRKVPAIIREANNRTQSRSVTRVNKTLTRVLYNRYSERIISLSNGVKFDLVRNFRVKESKIEVIYNPVEFDKIQELSMDKVKDFRKNGEEKLLIAVGRLVEQKDFKTLLKAFSTISQQINSRLIILGKGPKEEELKKQSNDLGIGEKVVFLGFKNNPYKYMRLADAFVLSSKWEGFGHVIVEAMATGTSVISTDCESGPREIILEDKYGILVPVGDDRQLSIETIRLLKDDKTKENMIAQSYKRAQDFNVKKIIKEYEKAFMDVK